MATEEAIRSTGEAFAPRVNMLNEALHKVSIIRTPRAYFNMLTGGAIAPALHRFAPPVVEICPLSKRTRLANFL